MKIGVIAGNFDVIHPGYIQMFNECKKHCTWLIVLLHEDPSIERPEKLKPILSVAERREMLLSLEMIDEVITYSTEKILYEFIKVIYKEKSGQHDAETFGKSLLKLSLVNWPTASGDIPRSSASSLATKGT